MDPTLSPLSRTKDESEGHSAPKKRARQACVTCHARKVKCDVSSRGIPCSNCIADECQCTIRQRARRNSKKKHSLASTVLNAANQLSPGLSSHQSETVSNQSFDTVPQFTSPVESLKSTGSNDTSKSQNTLNTLASADGSGAYSSANGTSLDRGYNAPSDISGLQSLPLAPRTTNFFASGGWEANPAQFNMFDDAFMSELLGETLSIGQMGKESMSLAEFGSAPSNYPEAGFSPTQKLLSTWTQINLPLESQGRNSDEVAFLRSQGCLSLPNQPILSEYVKSYFLYVSPAIPMIPESELESLLSSDVEISNESILPISMFVLQAILFASCSFISEDTNISCGFRSIRDARDAYYRRAKLLFDFEIEKDPFNIARGALLLAYQAPNDNVRRVNCYWLNLAIRSARIADADLYYSYNTDSNQRRCLKRLWWSCIFRDRILPLGLRRPVQIPLDSFDWSRGDPLTETDFAQEILHSKVYDKETQRTLVRVLTAMCSLCRTLTYTIMAAFPIDRNVQQIWDGDEYFNRSIDAIRDAKQKLLHWYDEAIIVFPIPIGLGDEHPSVVLFANLMYIYFRSGMIALCHREALLVEYRASKHGLDKQADLKAIQTEVIPSMNDVTERMREVVHHKMAKYLPISAVAYLTLPWIMYILDSKFAQSKAELANKKRRLQIFESIMDHQRRNFDGIEFVASMMQNLSDYIESQTPSFNSVLNIKNQLKGHNFKSLAFQAFNTGVGNNLHACQGSHSH